MNKEKLLLVLVLLTGLIWNAHISNASSFENTILKEKFSIEKNEKELNIRNKKLNNDNELIDNFNYINTILDKQVQKLVLEKLQNKITLTKFKKYINRNLAKRRKIHKKLLEIYNKNLWNKNYLQLVSNNWIKIANILKIKKFFLNRSLV